VGTTHVFVFNSCVRVPSLTSKQGTKQDYVIQKLRTRTQNVKKKCGNEYLLC